MAESRRKQFWRITVCDRGEDRVVAEIPITHTTENKVIDLLRMLFAKHWLNDDEITAAHLRANVSGYRGIAVYADHSKDPNSISLFCGSSGVHAIIVRPEDE